MSIIRLQSEKNKLERQYYEFDPEAGSLGQGGMGVVYKGRFFGNGRVEDVAIKVLYKDLPEEAVERALKEASIRIAHDNVVLMLGSVSIKDAGGSLRHHIISEYLDGETLDKHLLSSGRKSTLEALFIIKCVLSGLSALHNRNLVHRDIDPSNIMICKDHSIKIIDLGVVKELEARGQRKTVYGQFIGKIDYASPEQLAGLQDLVRQTSDIYSTGVVLYELITGRLPFTGTTYDITMGHKEKPVPLENIPDKNLRYIIRKATAKNIKDRYLSAYEFIVDIEKIQQGRSPVQGGVFGKRILMAGVAVAVACLLVLFFLNVDFSPKEGKSDATVKQALSKAFGELTLTRYPEALDAYRKAYDMCGADSLQEKINALSFLSQGIAAYTHSDYERAESLFRQAESLGSPDASYYLGEIYYEGMGVKNDAGKGFKLTKQAFDKGFLPAGYRLGIACLYGIGTIADSNQAASYFAKAREAIDKAASSGNPEWLCARGNMFTYGYGVAVSQEAGIQSYQKAAAQNYPAAHYELFTMYYKETYPQQISEKAMSHLRLAAELGYVKAQNKLGRLLILEQNIQLQKNGYQFIDMAARKNDPYALAQMGLLHLKANRIPKVKQLQQILGIEGDNTKALNYLNDAMTYDTENYYANYGMAFFYMAGNDTNRAKPYFKSAQDQIHKLERIPYRADELMYPNMRDIKTLINSYTQ